MKYITLILVGILFGCQETSKSKDYADETVDQLNAMKSPVILLAKERTCCGYNVTLIDSTKRVVSFGDMSRLSCSIGESRMVGDTIK